jgi:hypothetical protein
VGEDLVVDPIARALYDEVAAALPLWVARCVREVAAAQAILLDDAAALAVERAGRAAADDVLPRLARLLETDVDEQRASPLQVVRRAVVHPTAVLRALGARPAARDEFERRAFPDDDYRLSPATWVDLGPGVHEAGIVWGAWKAKTVLDRRRGRETP